MLVKLHLKVVTLIHQMEFLVELVLSRSLREDTIYVQRVNPIPHMCGCTWWLASSSKDETVSTSKSIRNMACGLCATFTLTTLVTSFATKNSSVLHLLLYFVIFLFPSRFIVLGYNGHYTKFYCKHVKIYLGKYLASME